MTLLTFSAFPWPVHIFGIATHAETSAIVTISGFVLFTFLFATSCITALCEGGTGEHSNVECRDSAVGGGGWQPHADRQSHIGIMFATSISLG
ncbi:hypothetical protein GQ42DRAFT_49454 [Ramicandelaber brevisporus]|nr:hypothetical protein GQ42DRAFT_49454 [Ramicandelaber brevisporus]